MNEAELHYCLWHYLPWLKPRQRRQLYLNFDSPDKAYKASSAELAALGLSAQSQKQWLLFSRQPLEDPNVVAVLPLIQNLESCHFIHCGDPRYPDALKEIDDGPEALYVLGDVTALELPSFAIVGSRRASRSGIRHASNFAAELAGAGFAVVSGGALGIDAAAHEGALTAGKTVAVVATGVDQCYPAQHRDLYSRIATQGAIISEFRLGTPPRAGHFPKRNRIIAGLSHGTLVVEAALKSGSLITARLASEYNREVFAIPGSIDDPKAKGCNTLIKRGAKLTESLMDIVEEFPRQYAEQSAKQQPDLSLEQQQLLSAIDFAYTPLELIAERSDKAAYELLPLLIELELQQLIVNEGGGYCRL